MSKKLKPMPSLRSDAEAENFVENVDLSDFDLSGFKPMRFEIVKKEASLNMRVPIALMEAVKAKAKEQGVPYSRYIRMVLEADIMSKH